MSIGTLGRITLHHSPVTRSARVRWLLHELVGNAFDEVRVDLVAGEQYSPAFLALNPGHSVPVLTVDADGGTISVGKSGAIVVLLADLFPDRGLAPPPAPLSAGRARYLHMIHHCGAQVDMALWQIRIHTDLLPKAERHDATLARYRRKFREDVEPFLASRLDQADHVVGPAFTAADCMVGHAVLWARGYGLCDAPVFRSYLSRVSKRPAFVAAFSDAHEFRAAVPEDAGLHRGFNG